MADVIKCDIYDHFEIACMRRSRVCLELHNGNTLVGTAVNLETRDRKEFLILDTDGSQSDVNLMDIDVLVFSDSGERFIIS